MGDRRGEPPFRARRQGGSTGHGGWGRLYRWELRCWFLEVFAEGSSGCTNDRSGCTGLFAVTGRNQCCTGLAPLDQISWTGSWAVVERLYRPGGSWAVVSRFLDWEESFDALDVQLAP